MPQLLLPDNIPALVRASGTTCTLAATHLGQPTRIKIGGQQYKLSSTLTLNTATTGLGGLDTGSLGAVQLWYVYACANSSGVVGLVASQTSPTTGPSGFTNRYQLVGAFYTDGTSAVGSVVNIVGPVETDWMTYTPPGTPQPSSGSFSWTITHARFKRKANLFLVSSKFTLVSTSTPSGQINYAPANYLASGLSVALTGFETMRGSWWIDNSGAASSADQGAGIIFMDTAGQMNFYRDYPNDGLAPGNPFTWDAGDELNVSLIDGYEVSGWNKTLLG